MTEVITKIEDILRKSDDVMWTIACIPDIKTYSIRIGELEPEDDGNDEKENNCGKYED